MNLYKSMQTLNCLYGTACSFKPIQCAKIKESVSHKHVRIVDKFVSRGASVSVSDWYDGCLTR